MSALEPFQVDSSTEKGAKSSCCDKTQYCFSVSLLCCELAVTILLWIQYLEAMDVLWNHPLYIGFGVPGGNDTFVEPNVQVWIKIYSFNSSVVEQFKSGAEVNLRALDATCYALDQMLSGHTPLESVHLKLEDQDTTPSKVNDSFTNAMVTVGIIFTGVFTVLAFYCKFCELTASGKAYVDSMGKITWFVYKAMVTCLPYMCSCCIIFLTSFALSDGVCVYSKPTDIFSGDILLTISVTFLSIILFGLLIGFCLAAYSREGAALAFFILFGAQGLVGIMLNYYMQISLWLPSVLYTLLNILELLRC